MSEYNELESLQKLPTGIEGFEHISHGGLTKKRATLIVGTSGSGKTYLAYEILHRSITQFEKPGVFVTMEEKPVDIIINFRELGWHLDQLIDQKKLRLIDASPDLDSVPEIGEYNLKALIARISHALKEINGSIVVIDSIGSLFHQFTKTMVIRREISRIINTFKEQGHTVIFTAERINEYGGVSRYGIEEFISDNVIILRNILEDEKVRRTIQILKMRGKTHEKGEFPFSLTEQGISIMPLSKRELKQSSSNVRCSLGNKKLDEITSGGIFRDSVMLISGPTGCGKTLMCATFVNNACQNNEKIIMFAYEESKQQLMRNAKSWGIDFEKFEKAGLLKVVCLYPEAMGLEEHLLLIQKEIKIFKPRRLVMDSVSAMERVAGIRIFREFVIGLTSFVKQEEVCSLFTSTTPQLAGGDSITEAHISTITDIIILLRYVELRGDLRRGIAVIKMRGSQHQKSIYEFTIDSNGLKIEKPFNTVSNIILGTPVESTTDEKEQLSKIFNNEVV
ncbi:circadian clock protein KaiC [Candidatus Magnetomorum sp. HK-1]|nr:circadian clock protein KaiC [Candidatus Magnetomorum sp. HK-1]